MHHSYRIFIFLLIALTTFQCSSPKKEQETPQVSPKIIYQAELIKTYQDSLKTLNDQLSELKAKIDSIKTQPVKALPIKKQQPVKSTPDQDEKSATRYLDRQQLLVLEERIASMKKLIQHQKKDSIQYFQEREEFSSALARSNNLLNTAEKRADSLEKLVRLNPKKIIIHDTIIQIRKDTFIIEKESSELLARIDSLKQALNYQQATIPKNIPSTTESEDGKNLSEAFRIYLEAKKTEPSDPTLALRLIIHARNLSKDSIISSYYNQLVGENIFYTNSLKGLAPIKTASIGSNRLITVFDNNLADYFDFSDPAAPGLIKNFDQITSAYLGTRDQMILGEQTGSVSFYSISREDVVKRLNFSDGPITAVNIIGNALYYWAIGTHEKRLIVLNKKYEQAANMVGMQYPINHISINPKTGYIATSCKDPNPRIWSPSGKLLLKIEDQPDSTMTVAISPSGKIFISGHANGLVKFWNIDGQLKAKSNKHQSSVISSTYATDQLLATGDRSGRIFIWNNYGDVMHELNGHTAGVTALQFADANTLYSSSLDGSVKQWNLGKQDVSVQPPLSDKEKARFKIAL